MYENSQQKELEKLSLAQVLAREDLVMQEILEINGIHQKITNNIEIFIDYCRVKHAFTQRFIMLGLKCPMHQSNSQTMKNMTYIAADILTSDRKLLADLFILPQSKKTNSQQPQKMLQGEGEIREQRQVGIQNIQTEEIVDKYKFLRLILDYFGSQQYDENCLNYIIKALNVVIRVKINELLEFLAANQQILKQIVEVSHFPSVACFLSRIVVDTQEKLSGSAIQVKQKIIPLVLQKIHKDIAETSTTQIFVCIEEILGATRSSRHYKPPAALQEMAALLVSSNQIAFYVDNLVSFLSNQPLQSTNLYQAVNSTSYLIVVVNSMISEQKQEQDPQIISKQSPTLIYEFKQLYSHFCSLIVSFRQLCEFKSKFQRDFWSASTKIVQLFILATKNPQFSSIYRQFALKDRQPAISALITIVCLCNIHGIVLQKVIALLQILLIEEQKTACSSYEIVPPGDLYSIIALNAQYIEEIVKNLLQESTAQRNRNQIGIFYRKLLLLLDSYFKNTAVSQIYPQTQSLSTIFPAFNNQSCRTFAYNTTILDYPSEKKFKPTSELQFIAKNYEINNQNFQLAEKGTKQGITQNKTDSAEKPCKIPPQLAANIIKKLKAHMQRVRQKQAATGPAEQTLNNQPNQPLTLNQDNLEQPNSSQSQASRRKPESGLQIEEEAMNKRVWKEYNDKRNKQQ